MLLFIEEINETSYFARYFAESFLFVETKTADKAFLLELFTEQCALKSNKIKLNLSISTSDNIVDKTLGSLTCDERRTVCLEISDVLQMYFITFDPAA